MSVGMRHSQRLKGMAAVIALVLLVQAVPQAAGQQSPSDGLAPRPSESAANGVAPSSSNVLPDSPGAVQSASIRPRATTAQDPSSTPPPVDQSSAPLNPDAENSPKQVPANPESSEQAPVSGTNAEEPAPNSSDASQSSLPEPPPQRPHEPVGTAAAESVAVTGVAASRPAGVAVAPAKQRRVRSILIKVGALVGAGVAVGTTMALSQGSPSRPPGSH